MSKLCTEQIPVTTDNDFEADKALFPVTKVVANGTYRGLSPLLQLHIRRLFITGVCSNDEMIIAEAKKVDKSCPESSIVDFLNDFKGTDEWLAERQTFLQERYSKFIEESKRIGTFIDESYDNSFTRLKNICENQIEQLEVLATKGLISPKVCSLRNITETLSKLFEMQRLIRGMSQSETIQRHVIEAEPGVYDETLAKLENILNAKTIDAKPLNPL